MLIYTATDDTMDESTLFSCFTIANTVSQAMFISRTVLPQPFLLL